MQTVAKLSISKFKRKYNDVIMKKLTKAGITYKLRDSKFGYYLMVNPTDFTQANKIVLSVSHTNPQY